MVNPAINNINKTPMIWKREDIIATPSGTNDYLRVTWNLETEFKNKVICVFGGTGSIGTLIIEHLKTLKPYSIRVFSNDENSLWDSQQRWGNSNMRYLLGDIRNLERVRVALKDVDYVFNCAAVKHVPFAEMNPLEAVTTNILGLENIINASIEKGVKKLLHISTDKAVEATCIMGATKFISERLIQVRWAQNPSVGMICVRLGNVWNSRGSILQLVNECKKQQKPIPITSLEMTRYFIQPEELIEFVFEAFVKGFKGEIFVPKLKIVNIRDIIVGKVGISYPYEIIGLRKGEKLTEKLLTEEELNGAEECERYWIIRHEFK